MKKGLLQIGIVMAIGALGLACSGPALQSVLDEPGAVITPRPDVSVDLFFNELSPYGDWVWVSGPGWVWYPYNVSVDWRPYRYGHWVYSDYGWTWVSDEDWGWAVYHYGRWHYEATYGWVWVPGTEWGPAWVVWHEGSGWTGWAPLPWRVSWHVGVGLDWGGIDLNVALDPTWWCFTRTRYMVNANMRKYIAPAARNVTLIKTTKHVTNYVITNNRIVNNSINVNIVQKAAGKPVRKVRVRHADAVEAAHGVMLKGSDLVIFRPDLHPGRKPQRRATPPGQADRRHPPDSKVTTLPDRRAPSKKWSREAPPKQVRRNERRLRDLEAKHAREREQLERIHNKESQKPPPGLSHKEVNSRQDAEHRSLKNKQKRERKLFKVFKKRPAKANSGSSKVNPSSSKSKSEKSKSSKSKKSKSEKSKKSKSGKSKSKFDFSDDGEDEDK